MKVGILKGDESPTKKIHHESRADNPKCPICGTHIADLVILKKVRDGRDYYLVVYLHDGNIEQPVINQPSAQVQYDAKFVWDNLCTQTVLRGSGSVVEYSTQRPNENERVREQPYMRRNRKEL